MRAPASKEGNEERKKKKKWPGLDWFGSCREVMWWWALQIGWGMDE